MGQREQRGIVTGPVRLATLCTIGSGGVGLTGEKRDFLPLGAAVGDQSGDGEHGVVEVFVASDVALHGPPLFRSGDGVFDADPL